MLKILAESFAVKGLCLEQQAKEAHVKKETIIKYYIQAGEMGLKYLQVPIKHKRVDKLIALFEPKFALSVFKK